MHVYSSGSRRPKNHTHAKQRRDAVYIGKFWFKIWIISGETHEEPSTLQRKMVGVGMSVGSLLKGKRTWMLGFFRNYMVTL